MFTYRGRPVAELPAPARYHALWKARTLALWLASLNPNKWEVLRYQLPQSYDPASPGRVMPGGILDPDERKPGGHFDGPRPVALWAHVPVSPDERIDFPGATIRITPEDYALARQVMRNEGLEHAWDDYVGNWHHRPLWRIGGRGPGEYLVRQNGSARACQAALIVLSTTRDVVDRAVAA